MRLTCRNCGIGFEQQGRGRPAHACSDACRKVLVAEWNRKRAPRQAAEYRAKRPLEPRTCLCCGIRFTPRHGNAGFCSRSCKTRSSALARFGLTPVAYAEMVFAQRGRCASCGDEFTDRRLTHIDHDHGVGRTAVRGILCQACNLAIGHLDDDPGRARRAAEYLERCAA